MAKKKWAKGKTEEAKPGSNAETEKKPEGGSGKAKMGLYGGKSMAKSSKSLYRS